MSNHVHFVVAPEREQSLAKAFGRTHCDYARYANLSRASCGHLWQARFFSCARFSCLTLGAHSTSDCPRFPTLANLTRGAKENFWGFLIGSSFRRHAGVCVAAPVTLVVR
jgi:putative transposase